MENVFKELREKNGLSQAEMSRRTGISQQALSHMEVSGRLPSADNLLKIANIFNVSADFLLGVEETELNNNKEIINLYNKMSDQEKQSFIKFGEYLIASRHQ